MKDIISSIIEVIVGLFSKKPQPAVSATPTSIPSMDVNSYRQKLMTTVEQKQYQCTKDAAGNITATYCNYFTQEVCSWFGWKGWGKDTMATQMVQYMNSHPQQWKKLETNWTYQGKSGSGPDYDSATQHANEGHLVVAGVEGSPHGHVCVIAPEQTIYSPKWNRPTSSCASTANPNFYGKGLSWAFKEEPGLFLFMGA